MLTQLKASVKQIEAEDKNLEVFIIIREVKQKIARACQQYEKQHKKLIPVLEMRKKMTEIINSLNF